MDGVQNGNKKDHQSPSVQVLENSAVLNFTMSTSKKRPRNEAEPPPDASRIMDRSAVLPRPLFPSAKINQREGNRGPKHQMLSASHSPVSTTYTPALRSLASVPKSSQAPQTPLSHVNPYLSEGVQVPGHKNARRQLHFNEPGRFASRGEASRKAAQLVALSRSIERRLGDDQMLSDFILAMAKEDVPEREWWDEPFATIDSNALLTGSVFHFPPMPVGAPQPTPPLKPMMLTRTEQRKLRRQRRLEVQKEKREQIRLGLLPPEESKLKMSNFMKVLGSVALEEPTRAEALVRRQIRERTAKHEQANAERALTEEQRRAKKIEYWRQIGGGTLAAGSPLLYMAVFQTPPLGPKERFKLVVNGGQMQLHGLLLRLSDKGLIVVEGSLRAITHYKRLLIVRMKWQPENAETDVEMAARLLWQGTIAKPNFQRLAWMECASDGEARLMLKGVGLEHILKTTSEAAPDAAPVV